MRIDDSCDRIGRIVKTIYKFKTQGNQQSQSEQKVWPNAGYRYCIEIPGNMNPYIADTPEECQKECKDPGPARSFLQSRVKEGSPRGNGFNQRCQVAH